MNKFENPFRDGSIENSPERRESLENQERVPSVVKLSFFRHSTKGEIGPDGDVYLSADGRELAADQVVDLDNKDLAKAWGSARIRTQETAALIMDGDIETPIGMAKEKTNTLGTKRVEADPEDRLNFLNDPNTVSGKAANEAYVEKRYLTFMVNESDQMVIENEEWKNTSYSVQAANIASIVQQYLENASDRWESLYRKETGEDEEQRKFPKGYGRSLERFFGSHQGVVESFLAKVLEKTDGEERKVEFVEALGGMGFEETEGCEVNVENDGDEKKVIVSFSKTNEEGDTIFEMRQEVTPELLREIIEEGDLQARKE